MNILYQGANHPSFFKGHAAPEPEPTEAEIVQAITSLSKKEREWMQRFYWAPKLEYDKRSLPFIRNLVKKGLVHDAPILLWMTETNLGSRVRTRLPRPTFEA